MTRSLLVLLALAAACGSKEPSRSDDAGPVVAAVPPPKVSKPSAATVQALVKVKEPRALLFFSPGPVADQVFGYLGDLAAQSGTPIDLRELDRLVAVEESRRFKVDRDGLVVLVSGDRWEIVALPLDSPAIEKELAGLDRAVEVALEKLARAPRQIALVEHQAADVDRFILMKQLAATMNFSTVNVTPGAGVPSGAVAIFLDVGVGPTRPAMQTIDRHLAAGGAALVAIEPRRGASLGPLEARLGLALAAGTLADPSAHATLRKDASDTHLLVTSAIAPHASLAGLGRTAPGAGLLFARAGALVERGAAAGGATRVVTIRSMPTAFLDLDDNGARGGRETAKAYPMAAAVSGRFKAIVVADASWMSDEVLRAAPTSAAMLRDTLAWLAGEEVMLTDTPAAAAELTSYPVRGAPAASLRNALWKAPPDGVRGVRFESRGRSVLIERKKDGLWGHFERPSPDGGLQKRDLPLGPEAEALLAALAAPSPLRTVGPLDATTRARYGLDDGTLTVDLDSGATHTLLVGSRVMAGNDRYVGDAAARAVLILPASLIDPLDQGEVRLTLRRLVDVEEPVLTRIAIARGDKTREAVRGPGGAWKVSGGGDEDAYLAEELVRAALHLVPTEFAGPNSPPDLAAAGRVTFEAGATRVDLDLYRRGDDDLWARAPVTRGLYARVSPTSARRVLAAIDQLLPP